MGRFSKPVLTSADKAHAVLGARPRMSARIEAGINRFKRTTQRNRPTNRNQKDNSLLFRLRLIGGKQGK